MPPDAKVIDKLDISKKLIVEKAEPEQPKQEMTQEITQPENEGKKKRRKKTVKDKETKKTKAE
jgi:hypothetical protein